ncbi:MAG TPA: polysaccharide deacetylase family protein [Candidatus Sulfotelmatobacter sp.]|nr:polysaccharide deacetylase family protein [Candidatus Sulfotelmatobacter sp.]
MRHVKTADEYRENLIGARRAVPALLAVFTAYDIHATWATVGFLFFHRRSDLLRTLPTEQPDYTDQRLSPYAEVEAIGEDENQDPFHFARSLLEQIHGHESQEIASQTFSHYYCLEPKQSVSAFRADLHAAKTAASRLGVTLKSIVFPGNQYDETHLTVCREMGFTAFRGNPQSRLYRPRTGAEQTLWVRGARLLDSYCNLSSHHCYAQPEKSDGVPLNVPASHFLRAYSPIFSSQKLQERRIMNALTYAAQWGLTYHLWWHPHNFGKHLGKNIGMLRRILDHFQKLRKAYGMQSNNMAESAVQILGCHEHTVNEDRTAVVE